MAVPSRIAVPEPLPRAQDYLKMDACKTGLNGTADTDARAKSYRAMGAALKSTDIVFSCSWGTKGGTFPEMIAAGCDLWRLWHDIEAKKGWSEVPRISGHWAEIADTLRPWSGPPSAGKGYHDPDQLIGGDPQYSLAEAKAQLGLWIMVSAPLILGNNLLEGITPEIKRALQSPEVLAVNKDPLQKMGFRLSESVDELEVWVRELAEGDCAVLLFNKQTPEGACSWTEKAHLQAASHTARLTGFHGGNFNFSLFECCQNPACVALDWSAGGKGGSGMGSLLSVSNASAEWVNSSAFNSYLLESRSPPGAVNVSVSLADLNSAGVYDSLYSLSFAHLFLLAAFRSK